MYHEIDFDDPSFGFHEIPNVSSADNNITKCNTATFALYIRYTDNKPPVFAIQPKEIFTDCIAKVPKVSATDACSKVTVTVTSNRENGSCPGNYTLLEKYTATDACGNSTVFMRSVHVTDTIGPVINTPSVICYDINSNTNVTAHDYCSNTPVKVCRKIFP